MTKTKSALEEMRKLAGLSEAEGDLGELKKLLVDIEKKAFEAKEGLRVLFGLVYEVRKMKGQYKEWEEALPTERGGLGFEDLRKQLDDVVHHSLMKVDALDELITLQQYASTLTDYLNRK